MTSALPSAFEELKMRLAARPYIDIAHDFDNQPLALEAESILHHTINRSRILSKGEASGWKACALRSHDGAAHSVETERYYGHSPQPASGFIQSELAVKCMATMALVERITYLDRCRRVRFAMLEPSGIVPPHRDTDRGPSLILYAPIVYPVGCIFDIENECGEQLRIPLRAGSVFLIDISRVHATSNPTRDLRISLIVEGPPRLDLKALLELQVAAA